MPTDARGLATRVPGWPLALFRIAYGLLYLDMALQKAPWAGYGWLRGFIEKEIAHPAFDWYAAFLKIVVLPNFGVFGFLTFATELAWVRRFFSGCSRAWPAPPASSGKSRSRWAPSTFPVSGTGSGRS